MLILLRPEEFGWNPMGTSKSTGTTNGQASNREIPRLSRRTRAAVGAAAASSSGIPQPTRCAVTVGTSIDQDTRESTGSATIASSPRARRRAETTQEILDAAWELARHEGVVGIPADGFLPGGQAGQVAQRFDRGDPGVLVAALGRGDELQSPFGRVPSVGADDDRQRGLVGFSQLQGGGPAAADRDAHVGS